VSEVHWYLNGDRSEVVGEHEVLQFWMAHGVTRYGWNDERCHVDGAVCALCDRDLIKTETLLRLRRTGLLLPEEIVRGLGRSSFEERFEWVKGSGFCASGEDALHLTAVVGIVVDLAVVEPRLHDERVGRVRARYRIADLEVREVFRVALFPTACGLSAY